LNAKIEATLPICHLEVLAVATGASRHRIQLLFRHDHYSPVFRRIERLQIIYHCARRIFGVTFLAQGADEELLAVVDEFVGHVHLLLHVEKRV
jgi:hypothetical protein